MLKTLTPRRLSNPELFTPGLILLPTLLLRTHHSLSNLTLAPTSPRAHPHLRLLNSLTRVPTSPKHHLLPRTPSNLMLAPTISPKDLLLLPRTPSNHTLAPTSLRVLLQLRPHRTLNNPMLGLTTSPRALRPQALRNRSSLTLAPTGLRALLLRTPSSLSSLTLGLTSPKGHPLLSLPSSHMLAPMTLRVLLLLRAPRTRLLSRA